ncbi:MAG: Asp-tRNA(Asn)/Glu-tRNA(Gln) amidotransferase subunit GatA [Candidatus Babeliales bacterium]
MNEIAFATIHELQTLLSTKKISVAELNRAILERFKKYDTELNSALELFDADSIVRASASAGPLYGIPGLIKDNIMQQNRITSCASKILEHFVAPYDATAVERLKQAGALLVGRANMDEFAMGSSTETSAFGKTKNPWDSTRVPGGSSGGSIAAVAAGLVPWALGSETGGSVRQPAAFCGVVGLKPTYGLISRYGLVAYASGLDQIGITTRTARDAALILSTIAGNDARDSSSQRVEKTDYTNQLHGNIKGLKIGLVTNAVEAEGIDPEVGCALSEAVKMLEKLGAQIIPVSLKTMEHAAAVYFIISRAQAASNLARFDGVRYGMRAAGTSLSELYDNTRHDGFGAEVRARIMIGNYVLSAGHADDFYGGAQKVQQLIRQEYAQIFKTIDCLFTPTTPTTAFRFGAFDSDKLQMDLQDYFTCPVNLAGIPAVSVPCGMGNNNLPIGMQLIGPHLSEGLLLRVADAFEQATPWHTYKPSNFVS